MGDQLFYISRDGSTVKANFCTGLPHEQPDATTAICLSVKVSDVYLAELLTRHLSQVMRAAIYDARKKAYEQGWKDAKSHKSKQDWFSELLLK